MTRFADLAALPAHLRAQVEAKLTGRVTTHRIKDDVKGWTPEARDRAQAGAKASAARRTPEAVVLRAILDKLKLDKRVRWFRRMNSGAVVSEGARFVKFGFPGCPDILGQLKDGRTLWIEVKRPQGRPTAAQAEFLALAASQHTVCGVARSLDDLECILTGTCQGTVPRKPRPG